jgi:hypothetical protein
MFKLLANLTVDSLDKVPEDLRGLYAEQDGKFMLTDANKGAAKVIDGLGGALAKVRTDLDSAKKNSPDVGPWKALAAKLGLDESDVTPEAMAEAIDTMSKGKSGKELADEIAKVKKSMAEGHGRALKAKDDEIGVMTKTLAKHLIENEANAAFAEMKGAGSLLMPHVLRQTKMVNDNGEWHPRVIDEHGAIVLGADGSPLPVKGLVKSMKADNAFARAFDSDAPQGGGLKPGSTRQPVTQNGGQAPAASPVSKISAGLRTNPNGTKGVSGGNLN